MKKVNKKKYVLNTKRILVNIIFIFAVIATVSICTSFDFGKKVTNTKKIIVQAQDTLWDISSILCENNSKLNIQNVIYQIKEINKLDNSNIYIGQVLEIPIY